jgi:Uma2 family endonuclease
MATALSLPLMTVEEFFELPDPSGPFTLELHFGELVEVGRANKKHFDLQSRIRRILEKLLKPELWRIDTELPYGLTPTYDARAADIGVCSQERWRDIPDETFLIGSPELVVQVKSRSNRDRVMEQDAITHITHGAAAVLLIRPERQDIVLFTASARTVYGAGQTIELPAPLSVSLPVEEIFAAEQ